MVVVNDWKQSAVVTFRGNSFNVCIAPVGHDMNAISAAARIARKQGHIQLSFEIMANPDECEIEWRDIRPTRNKNPRLKKPQKKRQPPVSTPTKPVFGGPKPPKQKPIKQKVSEKPLVLIPNYSQTYPDSR